MIISKYICNWYQNIFYIWLILGYYMNINIIKSYINPYYISILLIIYHIIFDINVIYIKKLKYDFSYHLVKIITHILPYLILLNIGYKNKKYAFETVIIVTLLYLISLKKHNKTIYSVYSKEYIPVSWDEIHKICKEKNKGKGSPNCQLINYLKKIS